MAAKKRKTKRAHSKKTQHTAPQSQKWRPGASSISSLPSNTTLSAINSKLIEYNQALVDRGMALSRKDLRKLDTIDTRNLIVPLCNKESWQLPPTVLPPEALQFLADNYWYCYIPCFEDGVLHVNTNRYIHWSIKKLDIENNRMDIFLQDYSYYDATGWQPGVSGVITCSFENPNDTPHLTPNGHQQIRQAFHICHDEDGYPEPIPDYVSMYTQLDGEKDLHWPPNAMEEWRQVLLVYSESVEKQAKAATGITSLEMLAHHFSRIIIQVNHVLANEKMSMSKPVETAQERKRIINTARSANQKPPPVRRVRTIGLLSVTSCQKPRASTQKTVACYKTAQWKRRGHIRTYKNGKRVYIKETTAHRKSLSNTENQNPIPTLIQFSRKETPS